MEKKIKNKELPQLLEKIVTLGNALGIDLERHNLYYHHGNVIYSTNGFYAVKIITDKKNTLTGSDLEKFESISGAIEKGVSTENTLSKISVKDLNSHTGQCSCCKGTGITKTIQMECCCEDGYHEFYDDCGNCYSCECKECEGAGLIIRKSRVESRH